MKVGDRFEGEAGRLVGGESRGMAGRQSRRCSSRWKSEAESAGRAGRLIGGESRRLAGGQRRRIQRPMRVGGWVRKAGLED